MDLSISNANLTIFIALNDIGQIRLRSTSHNNTFYCKKMIISKKDIILVGSLIQLVVFWYTDLYLSWWPKLWVARPKYYSTGPSEIYTLGKIYQTYQSKSIYQQSVSKYSKTKPCNYLPTYVLSVESCVDFLFLLRISFLDYRYRLAHRF